MNDVAVEADGLSKRYLLGANASRNRLAQLFRNESASSDDETRVLWALRDASFSIKRGEAVGIVGRNGAGKSTLLKLLSRVTKPSAGRATINGRVGTLLEVGTGFHPELTGRDNIFLSGTILGMAHREIERRFDEIVAFAEVERFIDTPVKRYSSGMYVRLAFAVASFLDPDILIVDEVLAVGDAAFQRKSLGRLNSASEREGRTVLFVNHNLHAIRTFCKRVIVLEKGIITFDGPVEQGIERYLKALPRELDIRSQKMSDRLNRASGDARFNVVSCFNEKGEQNWQIESGTTATLRFEFEVFKSVPDMAFLIRFRSAASGESLTMLRKTVSEGKLAEGTKGIITLSFPNLPLRPSELSFVAGLTRLDDQLSYDVIDENVDLPLIRVTSSTTDRFLREGIVSLDHRFDISLSQQPMPGFFGTI